jgi:hypothetical protein
LVDNAGSLVSHDVLLDTIWPETYVNPEILRKYILEIRKALGDSFKAPAFIETHAKRGYRFIAPVEDLSRNGHNNEPAFTPWPSGDATDKRAGEGVLSPFRQVVVVSEGIALRKLGCETHHRRGAVGSRLENLLSAVFDALNTVSDLQSYILVVENIESADAAVSELAAAG